MMQAEFKRENHKSFFVIKDTRLDSGEQTHAVYDLEMLCENQIQGILPASIHSFNGETEIYYDISTKQTLRVLFEKRKLVKDDLKWLFSGIHEAVCGLEKYFLDMECLLIDPDYIYINVAKKQVYLLYYPYPEESFETGVEQLAEYILDKICNEDEQTVVYAYNFYRFVKEEKGDLISVFLQLERSDFHSEKETEEQKLIQKQIQKQVQTQIETGDFLSTNEEELYLNEDLLRTEDENNSLTVNHLKVKRVIIFGFFALFGVGIMAFEAWRNQLGFEDLMTKKETIVGFAVCILSVLGFILFSIIDFVREKMKNREIGTPKNVIENKNHNKNTENAASDGFIDVDRDFFSQMDLETTDCEDDKKTEYDNDEQTPYGKTDSSNPMNENDMYETVLLQENCYVEQRILIGKIKGKKRQIDLSTFPFVIGKSKEQADYVIDDPSISRIHARFTLRDGIVFLTDLNSTNGSMKNGIRLQPNELVEVEAEDEIKFGRVTFTYY
ncbi:MAG: FHA domain-containing protein [Lachnospiraceae bacterium]|nr:FHA domain-containing protein [Lachnospiraceae bacterium]